MPAPLRIDVKVDNTKWIRSVRNGQKRLAFGTAAAINNTALEIQKQQRRQFRSRHKVRKSQFIDRQIAIIKPFANARAGRPFAVVSVGQKPRLLLTQFEQGGVRRPFKGKSVAVPLTGEAARPSFGASVPDAFKFTRLRFKRKNPRAKRARRRKSGEGSGVFYGLQGTYLIPRVGVFRRGPGGKSTLIYSFEKAPKLKPSLRWLVLARTVAAKWFPEFMEREKKEALRRAGFNTSR